MAEIEGKVVTLCQGNCFISKPSRAVLELVAQRSSHAHDAGTMQCTYARVCA